MQNIKLTQYSVRLRFEDVEKPIKPEKKRYDEKKYKKRSFMDPDFDSEEEYGREKDPDEESSVLSETSEEGEEGEAEMIEEEDVLDVREDKYRCDQYLVRREATLILLALKFTRRVIIFFNEKVQCARAQTLFSCFKLKAVQCNGNMTQTERVDALEQFQRGEVDYLLCTDLMARGLDIPAVKTVINFSFPTEPKRYLHRIGRTARAGATGVSITLTNEEERKEIKKLTRKMNQNLNSYMVNPKLITTCHNFIVSQVDAILHDIELELLEDHEMEKAYKEAMKAENMWKHRDEIESRPKSEWIMTAKEKSELKIKSKKNLKVMRKDFDENVK